ncbi:MAG TPA: HlyD family efflux transporter periplasmic adaptor subunit [Sedimentibacter sp.]|nr:HlyD family efflux transporter periplasmic adaptor subunit [Sedimentibacter sp.]
MKKKKYFIATGVIVIIFIIASLLLGGQTDQPETSKVRPGSIKKTVEETGTVFSKRVNTFYSDMSQRVETLNVSVGDRVKKGDIILVYENNYDLEIERANKQIEAITASYNESVKGADFQEISNLKLNISTIETNLNFARSNLEKIKTLYENNAISQVEYDEAKNNVAILENQLQEANNNYSKIIQGVSANVKKEYEAQIDEVMIQIKILEKNMEQASVKAEFDGVITELNVHQGSMTQAGVPTVEIQDDKNLGIYVEVLAEDAIEVTKGMAFNIIDDDEVIKELQVSRVYPKAQAKISDLGVEQKRVRIEADLDDADYKLGSEVDVEIVLKEKNNVLLVDKDAVYEKDNIKYVTVLSGKNEIETEITTGIEDDKYVEVLSGLSENDTVLIK